jgi:hypothetical protein
LKFCRDAKVAKRKEERKETLEEQEMKKKRSVKRMPGR